MLAPANPKLRQHIPVPQGRQYGRPLTKYGKPSILSGRIGWTARLGSESGAPRVGTPTTGGGESTPGHTAPLTSPWPTAEPLAWAPSAARVRFPVPR